MKTSFVAGNGAAIGALPGGLPGALPNATPNAPQSAPPDALRRATAAACVALAACAVAGGDAWAAPLHFADIQGKDHQTRKYTCATGKILHVTYWSARNGQSFAVVPVKGTPMLFVNTISGSGAKYQAGSYTWWTKGPRANLYDAMGGENAPPILSDCVTVVR